MNNLFDKDIAFNALPDLPPKVNLDTPEVFKVTIRANKFLAELKGFCQILPNPTMLLNTIVLQESKQSSAIENIVTTQDELYKATLATHKITNEAAKEVLQYREAMQFGVEQLSNQGVLTTNVLIGIMQKLRNSHETVRKHRGTKLANPFNGNIIYTPPEGEEVIRQKLFALEKFMNDDKLADVDPIVKMALVHYQLEAIHPFSDGNGRTGRILNILYLVHKGLLDFPVLYLSKFIIDNKSDYYRLLREVTENENWLDWVVFMVHGVAETAVFTLDKIKKILVLKAESELELKQSLGLTNARELNDLLYSFPYIKISVLEENGIAKRQTASQYLQKIEQSGWLKSFKFGREVYYFHEKLVGILAE